MTITLNADLGEGGQFDSALLDLIDAANIACGFHAGDPASMRATIAGCAQAGVAIGAHPSLLDRAGFGRLQGPAPRADEIAVLCFAQVQTLARLADQAGQRLCHVKPHGALYHLLDADAERAQAFVQAMHAVDATLQIVGRAGAGLVRCAAAAGMLVQHEAFADRRYLADGSLAPRDAPGAVLHSEAEIDAQLLGLLAPPLDRAVGFPAHFDTLCVHGDTPAAVAIAGRLRAHLGPRRGRLQRNVVPPLPRSA